MQINWMKYENKDHVLAWFLCEAMSKAGIKKFGTFDSEKLDVVLTVNGVEADFEETMKFLQGQLQDIEARGFTEGNRQAKYDLHDKIGELLGINA